ncbi:MAG: hypothetical protein OXB95_13100 [Rhodobacteraceae bacterium]|nr:hypothetical protein [Paracoccaceae bacterium]
MADENGEQVLTGVVCLVYLHSGSESLDCGLEASGFGWALPILSLAFSTVNIQVGRLSSF